ncbi:hypothetical protein GCM10009760_14660 [Kitasatospora kazusensis]|uniref:Alpha/beta hydrolase n=1 Tax=Kitasatospora kazusensis TaxID=407974 RepID=A0ABN2Z2L1_9ACTN
MTEQTEPTITPFGFLAPTPPEGVAPAPAPDATWEFPGGRAWVYLSNSKFGLKRPVLISDGFENGPSSLNVLWDGMERKDFPFVSELRGRGYDLIIIGYDERNASILENAKVATAAIHRAIAERVGQSPLAVGGFSMGGLVTRYALAKMEAENDDHETALYFSIDSPHRGAWVPIGLQALAHFMTATPKLSEQINSAAARQLLWRHIETVEGTPAEDELRTKFLDELKRVGGWPSIPRKIGFANGAGDGTGNGVKPGVDAVKVTSGWFTDTDLRTQKSGDGQLVARLKGLFQDKSIRTSGLPDIDGAPGGTLETFGIAGEALKKTGKTEIKETTVCFVPTVSALALRDLDETEDLYAPVGSREGEESELDAFAFAPANEGHSHMSEHLATFIFQNLPE